MYIDLAIAGLFLLASIKGYKKGFIGSILSVVGYLLGMMLAITCSAWLAQKIQIQTGQSSTWYPFIAFLLILSVTVVTVNLLGKFIKKTSEEMLLGSMDRLGGVLMYLLFYGLLGSMLLMFVNRLGLLPKDIVRSSLLYTYIQPLAPQSITLLGKWLPVFKEFIHQYTQK